MLNHTYSVACDPIKHVSFFYYIIELFRVNVKMSMIELFFTTEAQRTMRRTGRVLLS